MDPTRTPLRAAGDSSTGHNNQSHPIASFSETRSYEEVFHEAAIHPTAYAIIATWSFPPQMSIWDQMRFERIAVWVVDNQFRHQQQELANILKPPSPVSSQADTLSNDNRNQWAEEKEQENDRAQDENWDVVENENWLIFVLVGADPETTQLTKEEWQELFDSALEQQREDSHGAPQ
ncbi:hypothetical protein EJ08DRAFT_702404 [Tothia fuscella]|uniref:Uncharacterized protein n=1 Tax=Tothia fuscella TaxID=1048955 RepID=A0A9P4TSN8_9PEZI|nr:hypothetical protein EJ08DRAFT_702404 [Tothia fuscella]